MVAWSRTETQPDKDSLISTTNTLVALSDCKGWHFPATLNVATGGGGKRVSTRESTTPILIASVVLNKLTDEFRLTDLGDTFGRGDALGLACGGEVPGGANIGVMPRHSRHERAELRF
jgi:hypothetical protein